jgi:hypothetical protein
MLCFDQSQAVAAAGRGGREPAVNQADLVPGQVCVRERGSDLREEMVNIALADGHSPAFWRRRAVTGARNRAGTPRDREEKPVRR